MSNVLDKNAAFDSLDELLDASMDDVEGLPPSGVPPTGHYNLTVTAERGLVGGAGKEKEAVTFSYTVDAINELANPEEAADAAIGMSFTENFIPKGKDGKPNVRAIGALKNRLDVFTKHFNIDPSSKGAMGETINKIQAIQICAAIKKVPQKMEDGTLSEEFFNARIKDVTII